MYQTFECFKSDSVVFFNGAKVDKNMKIDQLIRNSKIESLIDPIPTFFISQIVKTLHIYKRFPKMKNRPQILKSSRIHALTLEIKNRMELVGFSMHKTCRETPYKVEYEVFVNSLLTTSGSEVIDKNKDNFNGWDDEYFYRLKFQKPIE
mmetsp:Transcript_1166/g.1054  ORF Transcript_1166/g.1054 Transcript_1166/m.1054 type:complete len:149 (-) Transcript_1166:232-678(-)